MLRLLLVARGCNKCDRVVGLGFMDLCACVRGIN